MKNLCDFPLGEFVESADACDQCGGVVFVRVDYVDEEGEYGHATIQSNHKQGCPKIPFLLDDPTARKEDSDFAGWTYSNKQFVIGGKSFTALASRSNVGICLNCEEFIVGVPLMLFPKEGDCELDFCDKCAKELGIIKAITGGTKL